VGPLAIARDATYVDTTTMPIDEVVKRVMALVEEKVRS
jgi:cytidylate kinase